MKNTAIIILIVMIGFALPSCKNNEQPKAKETAPQKENISLITLAPGHLGNMVKIPGVVEPFEIVQIYPRVSGFVKRVLVDRGTRVKKGALLMELEAPEINEHLAQAKLKYSEGIAVLQTSTDHYNRLLETSKTPGTVSPFDLSSAQSKMKTDEAMVQGALANVRAQEAQCAYLKVTAPFDGVITERNIHPGALVGPGGQNTKPLLILQQQDKFRLVVNLPEQVCSQVKNTDMVKYKINAIPGKEFNGKISRSSGSLNDRYRCETIEIDVPNDGNNIKAGMYAEVQIPTSGNNNAFVLPKSAVVTTTERKYVIAIQDDKTKWIDVTTGSDNDDSTEVFGPLKDGDKLVANASYNIKNGANTNTLNITHN